MRSVFLYLLEGMVELEIAYFAQGLAMEEEVKASAKQLSLRTVAPRKKPIRTMGGLALLPDLTLDELDEDDVAALILPGSSTWNDAVNGRVVDLAQRLLSKGIVIGAICGATIPLANAGVLDYRNHTSNSLDYLKAFSSGYNGESHYRDVDACIDGTLVTANGAAGLSFACALLNMLKVYSPPVLDLWRSYYSTGDAKYYEQMITIGQS